MSAENRYLNDLLFINYSNHYRDNLADTSNQNYNRI